MYSDQLLHGPSNCIVCGEFYADCTCGETGVNSSYYTDEELDGLELRGTLLAEKERQYWECEYEEEYQESFDDWRTEDQSY